MHKVPNTQGEILREALSTSYGCCRAFFPYQLSALTLTLYCFAVQLRDIHSAFLVNTSLSPRRVTTELPVTCWVSNSRSTSTLSRWMRTSAVDRACHPRTFCRRNHCHASRTSNSSATCGKLNAQSRSRNDGQCLATCSAAPNMSSTNLGPFPRFHLPSVLL